MTISNLAQRPDIKTEFPSAVSQRFYILFSKIFFQKVATPLLYKIIRKIKELIINYQNDAQENMKLIIQILYYFHENNQHPRKKHIQFKNSKSIYFVLYGEIFFRSHFQSIYFRRFHIMENS